MSSTMEDSCLRPSRDLAQNSVARLQSRASQTSALGAVWPFWITCRRSIDLSDVTFRGGTDAEPRSVISLAVDYQAVRRTSCPKAYVAVVGGAAEWRSRPTERRPRYALARGRLGQ